MTDQSFSAVFASALHGSPTVRARQLATKGRSRRAAACASTSLPRSVPHASTAEGDTAPMRSVSACPHASEEGAPV